MSYSDDVFRKDIIRELSRIAIALENIDMKMTAKNSFDPEDALTYIKDKESKARTFKDCYGCKHLFVTYDILSNEQLCRCMYYNKPINQITNCDLR